MTVLEKLNQLKYVLDWNLNAKGMDILPMVNEILEEYKQEIEENITVNKKEISKPIIGGNLKTPVPTIKELRAEYKEKFGKNAFNGWDEEVLISKLT